MLGFKENITGRKYTNYEFMKFIQRLKYEAGEKEFEYIGVVEKQKKGCNSLSCHFLWLTIHQGK